MKLKDFVYGECKKTKSGLSPDSLGALVLYEISQHAYFKDDYAHFAIVKRGSQYRLLSRNLNNIAGKTNESTGCKPINTDPKDFHNDKFIDVTVFPDDAIIDLSKVDQPELREEHLESTILDRVFISNYEHSHLNKFYEIVADSDSFNEVVEQIKDSDPQILITLMQNISDVFGHFNNMKSTVEFVSLIKNLSGLRLSRGRYQKSGDDVGFGITNARDYFNCNALEYLAGRESRSSIKECINEQKGWGIRELFVEDKTGEVPAEVAEILEDESSENWKAVRLFTGFFPKYKSKLLDVAVKRAGSVEKHFDIANCFFDQYKKNVLSERSIISKKYHPIDKLLVSNRKNIRPIIERVLNEFPVLVDEPNVEIIERDFKADESDWGAPEQYEFINGISDLIFYDDPNMDTCCRGLRYYGRDNFSYVKRRDNTLLVATNNGDLVGALSFRVQDGALKVNTINTAHNFRGKGVVRKLYKRLIEHAHDLNLPIVSTGYTEQGSKYLPPLKRRLMDENRGVLWLDISGTVGQDAIDSKITMVNSSIIDLIREKYSNVPMRIVREVYEEQKEVLRYSIENNKLTWDEEFKLFNSFFSDFKKSMDERLTKKNKLSA